MRPPRGAARGATLDLGSWSPAEVKEAVTLGKVRRALVEMYSDPISPITSLKVQGVVVSFGEVDILREAVVSLRDNRVFRSRARDLAGPVSFALSCSSELRSLDLG